MSRIADALQKAGMPTVEQEQTSDKLTLDSFRAQEPEADDDRPAPAAAGSTPTATRTASAGAPAAPAPVANTAVMPGAARAGAWPVAVPPAAAAASGATMSVTPAVAQKSSAVLAPTVHVSPAAMRACRENERLVVSRAVGAVPIQQYRKVASTLHQLQIERQMRSVLVTSAVAGEGKSLSAANLALTLSEAFSKRVLLIDADLRRPTLHTVFGVTTAVGLPATLAGADDPVATLVGVTERLSLLVAGQVHGDPVGVLTSDRMRQLLEEAVQAFDWVILDSPPVGLFPDAELLSMLVDGVVMVVRAGSTPVAHIQRAVATLTPERIVGAILNQTERVMLAEHGYYNDTDRYAFASATDSQGVIGMRSA